MENLGCACVRIPLSALLLCFKGKEIQYIWYQTSSQSLWFVVYPGAVRCPVSSIAAGRHYIGLVKGEALYWQRGTYTLGESLQIYINDVGFFVIVSSFKKDTNSKYLIKFQNLLLTRLIFLVYRHLYQML